MAFTEHTATTRSGPVQGAVLAADNRHQRPVTRFLGMAFGAPISGPARFGAPQREAPWTDVRDATSYGAFCPQSVSVTSTLFGSSAKPGADECLNLNVWTPGNDDGARPVMVWIHGGAYVTGTGSIPWYDGQRFASNHDVVVVTINYRLGALGYLDVSTLVPDAVDLATPNAGLLDQIAALEWVGDCIAAFGGDPANVTVFGESAGAFSIGTLLGAPAARGLFRRAILQSGAAAHISSPERAARMAQAFLDALGVPATRDGIASLADRGIDEILAASEAAATKVKEADGLPWQPSTGTASLPEHPHDVVRAGTWQGIDVLLGTTRDEMRMFTAFDPALRAIDADGIRQRLSGSVGPAAAETITDAYLADVPERSAADTWSEISTDEVFRVPAHRLATALHEGGANSMWAYEFVWPTPVFGGLLGSCHALEIPFVFDNLHQPGVAMLTGDAPERQLIADLLHPAWASFARHGDPNVDASPKAPEWLSWDPDERHTLAVSVEPELVSDLRGEALRRWPA